MTIFAATQMACGDDKHANIARAEEQVRAAAAKGARIILLQELFETPYFCKDLDSRNFELAHDAASCSLLSKFSALARELDIVLIEEAHEAQRRGDIFSCSYINFYIANDGVVMGGGGIHCITQQQPA